MAQTFAQRMLSLLLANAKAMAWAHEQIAVAEAAAKKSEEETSSDAPMGRMVGGSRRYRPRRPRTRNRPCQ